MTNINQKQAVNRVKQAVPINWDEIPSDPRQLPFTVLVEGMQGVGKTHFSMTFPEPIFILDTENRADVVAAKFAGAKKVYRKKITTFNDIRQILIQKVFPEHNGGTIVIDSGSDLQALAELEYLEEAKVEKIYPTYIWARVWEKIDNMLKLIREKGYYCVVTGRIKDEYTEDGKRTGYYVLEGYKKLPYRVDIHLRLLPNFTAEVYKNGFRNEPIDQVKVLERPSFTEIIAKLVMGAPGEIVLPQVELEEVKPKEEKKPKKATGKSPAREVKEKAEPRESDLEAQYDAVPNSEGNHLTPLENEAPAVSGEANLDNLAAREDIMEVYKYGLKLGLDNATLKMLLYDIRGDEVQDHDRLTEGMTVGELQEWQKNIDIIATEYLGVEK